MKTNILITGVAGLLGSNFSNWLLNNVQNINIIGIDDLSGGYIENINTNIIFYKENLNNYNVINEIFDKHKISYIYHFAAYAAEGLSPFIRKFNYNNNLLATTNLINLAIQYNIKRFIFTSSMAVYGNSNGILPFTEESPKIPMDPYGIAKLACEMDIKIANTQHNLDYCIIRPHNVYGKQQNIWDKYRNVLGIWINKILNNENITIYGDGEQTRAFTYIDDILEPLWNAAILEKSKNQEINLGGIYEISILNAAKTLIKIVNDDPEYNQQKNNIDFLQQRHEVKHAYTSYQKSIELLNFNMKTELNYGLLQMWKWAKKQPYREIKKWEKYELNKGLYTYWK